jgi:hypothetical protein
MRISTGDYPCSVRGADDIVTRVSGIASGGSSGQITLIDLEEDGTCRYILFTKGFAALRIAMCE